jgi:Ala-tRNA(Pro) deacylase
VETIMTSEKNRPGPVATTGVEAIVGFLEGVAIPFKLLEHSKAVSAAAEAHAAQMPPEQVAKTVVLHDGSVYVIVAISASDRLDLHKLRELLGATHQLRLASESEIARDFPTVEVGAVPPFGPMVPAAEVIDRALATQERILRPAGDHRHSVLVDPSDVVRISGAAIADIRED